MSTLFGSWHRPYLAVYEQALQDSIFEVIDTFPQSQRANLQAKARTIRMPYWDWAMDPGNGQPTVPTSIRDQTVTVTKPNGRVTIPNPLYSYSWGSSLPSEMGGGPWNNFPTTLRRPVSNPTRSNNNEMSVRFNNLRTSLRDRVFWLFASRQPWGYATTSQVGVRTQMSGNGVDSFESVHDAVHSTSGGESGGHMWYLDYSSFDPIFWLHHTNVDRLVTMHQYMTDTWVANGVIPRPMAQWNQGEQKNGNTPLKPFTKNTNGDFFTSNDIRQTRALNYVYPETANNNAQEVIAAINRLYGNGNRMSKRDTRTGKFQGRNVQSGDYHTVLSIQADKYLLDGSYVVHCFIGGASNSTSNSTAPYPTNNATAPYDSSNSTAPYTNGTSEYDITDDPNYVGTYAVLGGSKAGAGNSSIPIITEGCLPLTTALQGKQEAGEIKSLHPDDVEDYLSKNLRYVVIGPDAKEYNPDNLEGFHVSVRSCPVTPSESEYELPGMGEFKNLPKATENLPAGKPFTYTPTPLDYVSPGDDGGDWGEAPYTHVPTAPGSSPSGVSPPYPSGTFVWPYPTEPQNEEGYCVSKQTIHYVDPAGNFLYAESS